MQQDEEYAQQLQDQEKEQSQVLEQEPMETGEPMGEKIKQFTTDAKKSIMGFGEVYLMKWIRFQRHSNLR